VVHFISELSRRSRILIQAFAAGVARLACGASCVSGCSSLAAAARACSRGRLPPRGVWRCAVGRPSGPHEEPTHHGQPPAAHFHADPQVPSVRPGRHPRPYVARPADHPGSALALHRPARRQPGPDRPDVAGAQACDVRSAGEDGLQGDRGRLPGLRADRLRLRALDRRGRGRDPGRCDDLRTDPGPRGPDRADRRVAEGREARERPPLQRHGPGLPPGRLPWLPGRHQADRGGRHPAGDGVRREAAGSRDRVRLPVQPRDLHRHRTGLRPGGLRSGHGRLAARAGPRDHPEPARHRGALDPFHARGPFRVDAPPAASSSACPSTPTTTAARRSRRPSWP